MERQYPRLEVNLPLLRENMEKIVDNCGKFNISVCGCIKGCSGLPEIGKLFRQCGCTELGSSRIEEIVDCRKAGVPALRRWKDCGNGVTGRLRQTARWPLRSRR